MNKDTISFAAIKVGLEEGTLNDTNNPVWLGCVASMDDAKAMTDWFREIKLIEPDAEVTNIQHITGNVKGAPRWGTSASGLANPAALSFLRSSDCILLISSVWRLSAKRELALKSLIHAHCVLPSIA